VVGGEAAASEPEPSISSLFSKIGAIRDATSSFVALARVGIPSALKFRTTNSNVGARLGLGTTVAGTGPINSATCVGGDD